MAETLYDFTRAIDNKLNVDCIYFDISKAFDTIEIDRIIVKLNNLGFTGNIVGWIQNFLTNRKIRVKVMIHFPIISTLHFLGGGSLKAAFWAQLSSIYICRT